MTHLQSISFNTYGVGETLVGNTGVLQRIQLFSDRLPPNVDVITFQEVFCDKSRRPFCTVNVFPLLKQLMSQHGLTYHTTVKPDPTHQSVPMQLISDAMHLAQTKWWGVPVLIATMVVPLILVGCLIWLLWSNNEHLINGGLVVFCRWPILCTQSHRWRSTSKVLFPEYLSAKGFQWVRFQKHDTVMSVINVHLCAECSPEVGQLQLEELNRFITEHVDPDEPLLVQGDFNLVPSQLEGRLEGLQLATPDQGKQMCTWRKHNLEKCRHYDHFFYRGGHVLSYRMLVETEYLSHHVPIELELELDKLPPS